MNAIILDLETVPDPAVWAPKAQEAPLPPGKCSKCGLDLTEEENQQRKCTKMQKGKCRFPTEAEMKPAKDEFPPPYAHKIVCAGAMLIENFVPKWLTVLGAQPDDRQQEDGLLRAWAGLMAAQPEARIVTWNGKGFDYLVIEARAMRHGVPQPWYTGRNDKSVLDLQHEWPSKFGDYIKMHDAAKLIGLPGKNGIDGSMINALVSAGQLETAKAYCATDVVQTGYLYLRHCLVRGYIDGATYRSSCAAMAELWKDQRGFEDFVLDAVWLVP